ncbi:SPOR domain-containing protein [Paracoccus thiocyanatus]|uniref:SPOR domain-containing protein n=1 Tax=Paracoccus thiocyanatus TaxID=34006 RepID=UPI002163EFFE|nr:SPOR domain-containing protein [Paracoccus thiocyanatus]
MLEEALTRQVVPNLRPGELASDPRPMEQLPDLGPEPDSTAPLDALRATLAAVPALRQSMGGTLHPNRRLCELLGYDGAGGAPGLDDPTQGYCASLPDSDLSRLSFMRPIGSISPAPKDAPADARPDQPAAARDMEMSDQAEQTPATAPRPTSRSGNPRRRLPRRGLRAAGRRRTPAPPTRPGLIPAGARYVQIGSFADARNAERAAARVAAMGYPVLRGKDRVGGREVEFLMAGPFADRESIVRALDGIRKAGFRDAFPR